MEGEEDEDKKEVEEEKERESEKEEDKEREKEEDKVEEEEEEGQLIASDSDKEVLQETSPEVQPAVGMVREVTLNEEGK